MIQAHLAWFRSFFKEKIVSKWLLSFDENPVSEALDWKYFEGNEYLALQNLTSFQRLLNFDPPFFITSYFHCASGVFSICY